MKREIAGHARLVVHCDREHHQGNGYRASGFERWGETADGSKDVYIRRLKQPRWKWSGARQMFFAEMLEVNSGDMMKGRL